MTSKIMIVDEDGKGLFFRATFPSTPGTLAEGMRVSSRTVLLRDREPFTMDWKTATGEATPFYEDGIVKFAITVIGPDVADVIDLRRRMMMEAGVRNIRSFPAFPSRLKNMGKTVVAYRLDRNR